MFTTCTSGPGSFEGLFWRAKAKPHEPGPVSSVHQRVNDAIPYIIIYVYTHVWSYMYVYSIYIYYIYQYILYTDLHCIFYDQVEKCKNNINIHKYIWGWVKTYYCHILGNNRHKPSI